MIPNIATLVDRHEGYARSGLWSSGYSAINTRGWLTNFSEGSDQEIARALLDSFLFFSDQVTKKLFLSAFHSLSARVEGIGDAQIHTGDLWKKFLTEEAVVTYTTDTSTEITGSGPRFATIVRDSTLVTQNRILAPNEVVRRLSLAPRPIPIIVVDDFAGTGEQFMKTWTRDVPSSVPGEYTSLECMAKNNSFSGIYYVVAVAAENAVKHIRSKVEEATVVSGYLLDDSYEVSKSGARMLPSHLVELLPSFLERYTVKAGYKENESLGFQNCGYTIGFESSIPDNSLAIFRKGKSSSWTSLRGEY